MVRCANCRDIVEKRSTALDRLKVGVIVFLYPYCVKSLKRIIEKIKEKRIFWIGIADRQRERGQASSGVKQERVRAIGTEREDK